MAKETTFLGEIDPDDFDVGYFVSVLEGLDRDDLKFLSSLPDDEACGLVLIMKENPLGLMDKIGHSIRNEDVPVQLRAVAHLLLEEVRRQLAVVKRACRVFLENRDQEMVDAFIQGLDARSRVFLKNHEQELVDAFAQGLEASMKIGNLLRQAEVLLTCGPDQIKAMNSRDHEARTILAANARRSAEAAQFWRPYREEFQRLVSEEGMKPDRARGEILNKWADRAKEPSMKTARKWLRLDGEAD